MKRLHVHLSVADLDQSTAFYRALFGAEPTLVRDDYVRWMIDDPRVNFSISARGRPVGVDHMGIQAESEEEMASVLAGMRHSAAPLLEMGEVTCCYSRLSKSWVADPQGLFWETFITRNNVTSYGEDPAAFDEMKQQVAASACCGARPPADPGTADPGAAAAEVASCCGPAA